MKKILIVLAFIFEIANSANCQTQHYNQVKIDFMPGFAVATSNGVLGGFSLSFEPHYRISDNLAIGVRFESALIQHVFSVDGYSNHAISAVTSYAATVDHYFGNGRLRKFVGAGIGGYIISDVSYFQVVTNPTVVKIGGFPRIGFEYGHFRLAAEYNLMPLHSSYFDLKAGFFFGGGLKKLQKK